MNIVDRFMILFRGFENAHGIYGAPQQETKPTGVKWSIKTSARTIREPATRELFEKHLKGEYPLGIIPIMKDGTVLWASVDVDDYSLNPLHIVQRIEASSYPFVPVTSKSGGLHLFMFFEQPQSAVLAQTVLEHLAAKLGLAGAELFPKQTAILAERGDVGNWLCLPYLGTTFDNKFSEQTGIKRTGARLTIEEFLNHAERAKVSTETLTKISQDITKTPVRTLHPEKEQADHPFMDGPPCLQHLADQGIQDGGRNSTLFMMALYYIRKYDISGDWRKHLEDVNRRLLKPPLDATEVASIIRSIEKKGAEEGYKYTCKTQPMVSHCNSKLCRGRRYGIGSDEETPKLTGVTKLDTEPPLWFINIGDLRIEATTDQLQNYMKFHALCMEKGNVCYRAIKQPDWMIMVGDVMRNEVTVIDVPPDSGITGHFKELLEEYLVDRLIGDDEEDLLRGIPWRDTESNRIYFTLSPLQSFLEKQGFKHYNRSRIIQKLKELGATNLSLSLKGRDRTVWFVGSDKYGPPPSYETPPIPKTPI